MNDVMSDWSLIWLTGLNTQMGFERFDLLKQNLLSSQVFRAQ